jgi:hypothetical protein
MPNWGKARPVHAASAMDLTAWWVWLATASHVPCISVAELVMEGKLRVEDRQIIVEHSEWIPPPCYEK